MQLAQVPSSSPSALRKITAEAGLLDYIKENDLAAHPLSRTQAQSIITAPNSVYWGQGKRRFERTGADPALDLLFSLPLTTSVCVSEDQFPSNRIPEVAIAGRSNVGKSTLMSCLPLRGPGSGLARLDDKPEVGPRPGLIWNAFSWKKLMYSILRTVLFALIDMLYCRIINLSLNFMFVWFIIL